MCIWAQCATSKPNGHLQLAFLPIRMLDAVIQSVKLSASVINRTGSAQGRQQTSLEPSDLVTLRCVRQIPQHILEQAHIIHHILVGPLSDPASMQAISCHSGRLPHLACKALKEALLDEVVVGQWMLPQQVACPFLANWLPHQ